MIHDYKKLHSEVITGKIKVHSLVEKYLLKINETKDLNIYLSVYADEALKQAQALDNKIKKDSSQAGKCAGMILSIKDVICYKDHPVTAGSKILNGFHSLFTATALQNLIEEDAIIIGRVNCDEFAMGSSNENSAYGPTKNGDNPERVPGGSSGASAVSVQVDTCTVAIGSDTGGSVRQPASFCNVIGMKPSYGRISRYGLIAYASSFDQFGILSKDLYALSLTLSVMAGEDYHDATSSTTPVENYHNFSDSALKKIAYFPEVLEHDSISDENRILFSKHIEDLKKEGHEVCPVSFDLLDFLVPTYYILTTAEASSNLSRYDGIRYGHRTKESEDIHRLYKKSRGEGFGLEVKRRIMLGTFVLSEGYFDAYYTKAQKARNLIKQQIEKIFTEYDFLMLPTTTSKAWKIGDMDKDPVSVYMTDIFTVLANLCGIPAISIPYKSHNQYDDNYGIQYMAPYMEEKKLLDFINTAIILA